MRPGRGGKKGRAELRSSAGASEAAAAAAAPPGSCLGSRPGASAHGCRFRGRRRLRVLPVKGRRERETGRRGRTGGGRERSRRAVRYLRAARGLGAGSAPRRSLSQHSPEKAPTPARLTSPPPPPRLRAAPPRPAPPGGSTAPPAAAPRPLPLSAHARAGQGGEGSGVGIGGGGSGVPSSARHLASRAGSGRGCACAVEAVGGAPPLPPGKEHARTSAARERKGGGFPSHSPGEVLLGRGRVPDVGTAHACAVAGRWGGPGWGEAPRDHTSAET